MGDASLLRRRRGVHIAKELDEVLLGPIRPVREREEADDEREERDQREEDLVGDRASEERAIVFREALDDRAAARNGAG